MTVIEEFNPDNLKVIRAILDEAFRQIFVKTGAKMTIGGITYTKESFSAKLQAVCVDPEGVNANKSVTEIKYANDFKDNCWRYNMNMGDLNKFKNIGGTVYKLIGCSTKSSKYPLCIKQPDGKIIRCNEKYWKNGNVHIKLPVADIDSFL